MEGIVLKVEWIDKPETWSAADVGDDVFLPFRSTWRIQLDERSPTVEVVLVAESGRIRVSELRVVENGDAGLTGVKVAGVSIQQLGSIAATYAATRWVTTSEDEVTVLTHDPDPARISAAIKKATRRRITQEYLAEVADAYRHDGIQGIRDIGVGERHAWRLKKAAQEVGLLPKEH